MSVFVFSSLLHSTLSFVVVRRMCASVCAAHVSMRINLTVNFKPKERNTEKNMYIFVISNSNSINNNIKRATYEREKATQALK